MSDFVDRLKESLQASKGRGRGRVEVESKLDEIRQGRALGAPYSAIWKLLHDDGEITVAYGTFVQVCKQLLGEDAEPGSKPAEPEPAAKKNRVRASSKFSFDEDQDKESLNMKVAHFVMSSKGGVGKSVISSILAQHQQQKAPVFAIDADSENRTFAKYRKLEARELPLVDDGVVNQARFDELVESILTAEDGSVFVIDTGGGTYLPLSSYFAENETLPLLRENGVKVYLHTPIAGAGSLMNTLQSFEATASQLAGPAEVVAWENEFLGPIADPATAKTLTEFKAYTKNEDKVAGIVQIPRYNPQTFGASMKAMLENFLTFDEAQESDQFRIVSKSRLQKMKRELFEQLDVIV